VAIWTRTPDKINDLRARRQAICPDGRFGIDREQAHEQAEEGMARSATDTFELVREPWMSASALPHVGPAARRRATLIGIVAISTALR
jgi:hypothetical protein